MIYLFSKDGIEELERYCDADTLFAFDYDGTLAAIVDDPNLAVTNGEVYKALRELIKLAPTAVITGRALSDIRARIPLEAIHHIGNHGIEGVPISKPQMADFKNFTAGWVAQLAQYFIKAERGDLLIEDKVFSLSIHYRKVLDPHAAVALILKAVSELTPLPRVIYGDCVVNLLPSGAPHKGHALLELALKAKAKKIFFIGDDQTDEDVFGLDEPRLMSVKVRTPGPVDVPTHAKYYINSQIEMLPLLRVIIERLRKLKR
jgi:trehalose 6-phosphate phosphatase